MGVSFGRVLFCLVNFGPCGCRDRADGAYRRRLQRVCLGFVLRPNYFEWSGGRIGGVSVAEMVRDGGSAFDGGYVITFCLPWDGQV